MKLVFIGTVSSVLGQQMSFADLMNPDFQARNAAYLERSGTQRRGYSNFKNLLLINIFVNFYMFNYNPDIPIAIINGLIPNNLRKITLKNDLQFF